MRIAGDGRRGGWHPGIAPSAAIKGADQLVRTTLLGPGAKPADTLPPPLQP
jgi:hypothetical protein